MRKGLFLITPLFLICAVLLAFFAVNKNPPDDYITMTYSYEDIDADVDIGNILTKVMVYDIKTKITKEVFEFYNMQYPLGFYDAESESVYYTKDTKDTKDIKDTSINEHIGEQIFVFDTKLAKETPLTNDIFAINCVVADGDKVFFVGRSLYGRVIKLGLIDMTTNTVSYWGDEDTNIEAITLDKKQKKIIASGYSESERFYNVTHQEGPVGENNMKMPTYTVYEIDYSFENANKLFEEALWIRAVMVHDNDVYALCDSKYNATEPSSLYRYNRSEESVYTSEWPSYRLQVGDAGFSSDGKHLYSLSTVDDQRGIYDFDLVTGEIQPIMIPEFGVINNMQVVNY